MPLDYCAGSARLAELTRQIASAPAIEPAQYIAVSDQADRHGDAAAGGDQPREMRRHWLTCYRVPQ
jgi:hypothetical protein